MDKFFSYSNVIEIDDIGKIGLEFSTSNAVAIQSLAVSISPNDSKTFPKLYQVWCEFGSILAASRNVFSANLWHPK